jgi:hypothetical protein
MKLHIVTICLDGMPQIRWHLPVLDQLKIPWQWHIAEGAAANVKDTAWCKAQQPRLSRDGTTEYLNALSGHPRVRLYRKQMWDGKVSMFNTMLSNIKEPCVLLQMDSDELWTATQLEKLVELFGNPSLSARNCAYFYCRYYIGPNIVITSENTYGNKLGEWMRAWHFTPGMKFKTHEPPIMENFNAKPFLREMTMGHGLVFQHFAYCFPEQVAFKELFYGYKDAVSHWRRLQANTKWPVKLKTFLPWVKDDATADLLWKP